MAYSEKCRVGMIGAGNVAHRHARVLSGFADVEIVGVTDVVPTAAEALASTHGAPAFPDVATLLSLEPDAVYVCVPPFAHGHAEEAVLASGAAMFVEKPLGVDLTVPTRLAAEVARRGTLTAVGHHWRYLDVVRTAAQLLADHPVRLVNGVWWDKVPPVAWWIRSDRSGGPVVEQAAHVVDLARALVGPVTAVYAAGTGTPPPVPDADVDAATAATLIFSGGAVGTLSSACVLGWKQRAGLEIIADGLALFVGEDELVVRDGAGQERRIPGDPDAARVAVDRAFVDAIRGIGDDIRVPYAEALETHRVTCAIAESARTGQPVTLAAPAGPSVPAPRSGRAEFDGHDPRAVPVEGGSADG
ncbi:Predicted dehydrogenase [Asanoa hainanensis]|uniref:Predicted dehydrogenase n=1 Tax=Asanoa hainanensis TaxID=560556 RepID=A0A239NWB6_9ACTN|nr:Gfo/Idh/MocA family oxidoreductase [Asanoa hainanensis]SNT59136.1 Predicted dehydrogenase [Asanoa hainanensis]